MRCTPGSPFFGNKSNRVTCSWRLLCDRRELYSCPCRRERGKSAFASSSTFFPPIDIFVFRISELFAGACGGLPDRPDEGSQGEGEYEAQLGHEFGFARAGMAVPGILGTAALLHAR